MGEWKEKKNRAPDLKYLERESLKKGDSDTGTAADVELVMKKYDRESNTRVWQGKPASIIRWLSVLFSVYSIYVTLFSTALPEIRLSMFLGMILILGYLHYPIQKGDGRINHMPWYDWQWGRFHFSILRRTRMRSLSWRRGSRRIRLWC